MTATLPDNTPVPKFEPIPRMVKGKYPGQNARAAAQGVTGFLNSTAALRYQHLPDCFTDESDAQIEAKLVERFAIMRTLTKRAINQRARAVVISGPGGVGKTFDVDKIVHEWDPEDEKHTNTSGYARATGLYKLFWEHRHKGSMLKFDDSDSIFFDTTALNFLKIACDTTEKRILSYRSEYVLTDGDGEPIPKSFEFNGTVIFISNLDFDQLMEKSAKLAPHLEALTTRSYYINMGMRSKRDYLIRLFMAVDEGLFEGLDLTEDMANDTLNFIETNYRYLRECSLRMGLKIANLRKDSDPESDEIPWDRMAIVTCCRPANIPPPPLPEVDLDELVQDEDEAVEAVAADEGEPSKDG